MIVQREDLLAGIGAVRRAMGGGDRLAGIHFCSRGLHFDVVATNGHWIARYRCGLVESDGDGSVTIASAEIQRLTSWLSLRTEATVDLSLSGRIDGVQWAQITATYPQYEQLYASFRPNDSACPAISFDAAYMSAICASFASLRPKRRKTAVGLVLEHTPDAMGPLRVTCTLFPELVVLLMPCRL